MGAWGHRSFENDDAADFGSELEARGWKAVLSAIHAVFNLPPDDLEAPEASQAIAAAEVIAAVSSGDASRLPPEIRVAVARIGPLPDPALIVESHVAAMRVLTRSELQELWAEGDDSEWRQDVEVLVDRLR